MKDFLQLVKAVRASSLVLNKKGKNGKRTKSTSSVFTIFLMSALMNISFIVEFYSFFSKTNSLDMGKGDYFSYLLVSFSSFASFGFFLCLVFISSILFRGDNDIFLSLPISGNKYFLAKLTLALYINFMYGGLAMLISCIMVCILLHLGFLSYLISIGFFLIYVFVTPCLAFLVTNFFSNFIDFKRRSFSSVVYTAIVGILAGASAMLLSLSTSFVPAEGSKEVILSAMNDYAANFKWITWIGYPLSKSILIENPSDCIYFLIYIGIGALILFFSLFFARRSYLSHLGKTFSKKKKKLSKEENQMLLEKKESLLLKKNRIALNREFSLYKGEKGLFIDAFSMPFIMLAAFGITLYSFRENNLFMEYPFVLQAMVCGFLIYSFYYYVLPSVSLSLEGKSLVLMKTLPMDRKNYIFRKLLPSFAIYYPITIVMALAFFFAAPFSFDYLISVILISISYPFMIILFSFLLGVIFPKPNYSSTADLLKKGWSATICNLGHLLFFVVEAGVLILCAVFLQNVFVGALIAFALNILLGAIFFALSKKRLDVYLDSELTF